MQESKQCAILHALLSIYPINVSVTNFRFEALIEREWLQAGHAFAKRNAKSAFAVSHHRYEAPIFLLFLDCVWQVWRSLY